MPSELDLDPFSGQECRDFNGDGVNECKYYYIDTDVLNGIEYSYSVVSYDTGIADSSHYPDGSDFTPNPDEWARPNGYQYIESSRGSTVLGTANVLMAATLARGDSTLKGCARPLGSSSIR